MFSFLRRKKNYCPLVGTSCLEHDCKFYGNMKGTHPQTGQELDNWNCTIVWLQITGLNIGRQINDLSVDFEELRNWLAQHVNATQQSMNLFAKLLAAVTQFNSAVKGGETEVEIPDDVIQELEDGKDDVANTINTSADFVKQNASRVPADQEN